MRNIFGWSYPPGCSGPPEDVEPIRLKCKKCHKFLSSTPTRTKPFEASSQCSGDSDGFCGKIGKHEPHKIVWDQGVNHIYVCKSCRTENSL